MGAIVHESYVPPDYSKSFLFTGLETRGREGLEGWRVGELEDWRIGGLED